MGKLSKNQLPQPYLREDYYLAKMAGLDVELPDALYTSDYYLKYIAENGGSGGSGGSGSGIASDIAYDNAALADVDNVAEALDMIISKLYYVAPKITSFTATPAGGVFEVGTTISAPTFNWSYNKAITSQTLTNCTLSNTAIRTASYISDITTDKSFTLQASDGNNTVQTPISYKFVPPSYYGVTDDVPVGIDGLTKKLRTKGTLETKFTTDFQHIVYLYPATFGSLRSILDSMGFENITDFTVTNLNVNGVAYKMYYTSGKKTSTDFLYKFIF